MLETFTLPYVQEGLIEILLLSVPAGLIGTWIVLRGLSFYSHAIGTASFPGLVLADGLGFPAALGAFGMAGVFTALSALIARSRRAAADSVTALALVTCLAVGVILASDVFGSGANVDTLLFGSLLAIGTMDLVLAGSAAVLAIVATRLFSAHWLAKGFDEDAAGGLKSNSAWFDVALFAVVAFTVTATLSAVGALLVAALMVIPAATVRMFTRRVTTLQIGTVLMVAVQGTVGLWLSVETNAPPGATIAVVSGVVFALALVVRSVKRSRKAGLAAAAVGASLVIAGCGGGDGGDSGSDKVQAVATTTQVADMVREVGGDSVEVTQILQPNTDPHNYEPRPSDVAAFADADVVFTNGRGLDEWATELANQSNTEAAVIDLGSLVPVRIGGAADHDHDGDGMQDHTPAEHGEDEPDEPEDPHWWHNPFNVQGAAGEVAAGLVATQPSEAAGAEIRRNADSMIAEASLIDRRITQCFSSLPAGQLKLVTDDDAFEYFADRYEIEVVGDEKRSDEYTLYGDTLGPEGSGADSWAGMMKKNADSMMRGFTGGERGCDFD